jgi:hypothetical protein
MDINCTPEELILKIKNKLINKEPFLITRYGEGEMRMFKGGSESEWIIKNMIGYIPSESIMNEIRTNMELGLINSDITGLPSYKNLTTETKVLNSPIHDLYKQTYSTFREIFNKHKKKENDFLYCDVNIHTKFVHKKLFEKLLTDMDELTIITCRDVSEQIKKYFKIKKINHYIIPPEFRFEDNPSKIKWNFYPNIHTEIKNKIISEDNTGKLCLYGAGLIGKDLGYFFKKSGGVAFDIGSVFDHWLGKVTRGKNKGRNVYIKSPLL